MKNEISMIENLQAKFDDLKICNEILEVDSLDNSYVEILNDFIKMVEDFELKDLISGNKSTLQLLQSILEQFNVKTIDPHGEPFNAEYHEAMSMETSEKLEPGTVITVYQKGYLLNDRLLRPARVVVSKE